MSDNLKFDLEDLDDLKDILDDNSKGFRLNFQKIYAHVVLNWYWYIISLVICIGAASLYLYCARPTYEVTARMLVKDGDKKTGASASQVLSNMEDFGFMNNSSGFENEMEILASPVTIHDAVKRLKLYTEYRFDGGIRKKLAYSHNPVCVDIDPLSLDSLDYRILDGVCSISASITKQKKEGMGYHADVDLLVNDEIFKTYSEDFNLNTDSAYALLPESVGGLDSSSLFNYQSPAFNLKTDFGTISFRCNPKFDNNKKTPFENGSDLLVTIRPPMYVALDYMRRLKVEPTSKKTSIASISLKDEDVRRGIDFLNTLVLCYNDQANVDKNEIALKTEEFINQRLEKIDAELGTTENSLENYKRRNAVTQLEADASQSLQLSAQYASRLADANTQLQLLDYIQQYVENPDNRYKLIPANIGMNDQTATQLITDYNKIVQERNRLMRSVSEQSPQVQTMTSTLDNFETSIRQSLVQARHSLELQRNSIKSQYDRYQGRIGSTPEQERVLNQIGRQQEVRSGIYLLLLQKREENSISLAATADKGKLIAAPLNNGKVGPRKKMVLTIALLLGLLFPLVVSYVRNLLRYRIEGRMDVTSLTKVPILADVPEANDSVKDVSGIVVQADKNNQINEVFRTLRANVQFMLKDNEKIILFTSGTPGEGKTFLTANLAMSFALLGKRVVLVGCDIRRPALGKLFGTHNLKQGLSNLLRIDKVTAEELHTQIVNSRINPFLDLLMSGPVPPNPTELLSRHNMKDVLDLLCEEYDYVILDTSPIGLVSDTFQLSRYANINCFVCRADYTPKSNIALLNSMVEEKKLLNACIVLNGVDMSKKKYGYYYGYGRYGKYSRYSYGKYGYGSYIYGSYGNYAESHYGDKDDDSIKK